MAVMRKHKRNPYARVKNDPENRMSLALPKTYFGPAQRYALAPVHSMRSIEWWVWDRWEDDRGMPAVVRRARDLPQALANLPHVGLSPDVLAIL